MEVRDPIHGSIEVSKAELAILDTPLLQRLRNIKQLGFADMAFPGATHSRYLHSIGTMLLAGHAFDSIFKSHVFRRQGLERDFRTAVRLGALLHDVGHAPLSHSTESAMPPVATLDIVGVSQEHPDRRANHEDYSIKIITDSHVADVIRSDFTGFSPTHVAALLSPSVVVPDDFFVDNAIDYRTVLSQIISSELDADRMDYLRRDSYFAGVSYGTYDHNWIFSNLTFHVTDSRHAHMGLDPRAIYAFNDFLIARLHMFLMVYFHHKPVIFEEMLRRYFDSPEASYAIPPDIDAYTEVDDFQLYHTLRQDARAGHPWARRIVDRNPYRLLNEWHGTPDRIYLEPFVHALEAAGVDCVATSSTSALSKYSHPGEKLRREPSIYALEKAPSSKQRLSGVRLLEQCTDLFEKYEEQQQISRIYVPKEQLERAGWVLSRA